jgi:hypothetical protein
MERRQLDPAVAVRGPHNGDVRSDAVQPDELVLVEASPFENGVVLLRYEISK